jgi:hypothetical protein
MYIGSKCRGTFRSKSFFINEIYNLINIHY